MEKSMKPIEMKDFQNKIWRNEMNNESCAEWIKRNKQKWKSRDGKGLRETVKK